MLDVVVTCRPRPAPLTTYPQVRGFYLAKHLARLGLSAEFRELPLPDLECRVVISSEYQADMPWFERHLLGWLTEIRAERWYCLAAYTLGERDHFSRESLEWFGARGGVLCGGLEQPPTAFEHWVGVGVDTDVVPRSGPDRNRALFDFPRVDDDGFYRAVVPMISRQLPGIRLVGSGAADAAVRPVFPEWVPYGQSHPTYVSAALRNTFAIIPTDGESLGLTLAEAQVAGACIVYARGDVKQWMLCPDAPVSYSRDAPSSLGDALEEAMTRDAGRIAEQAHEKFDYFAVAERTRAAIGL